MYGSSYITSLLVTSSEAGLYIIDPAHSLKWLRWVDDPETRDSILGRNRNSFCLFQNIQSSSGDQAASYSVGTGRLCGGVERPERVPPSIVGVKNEWIFTSSPYVFMVWHII